MKCLFFIDVQNGFVGERTQFVLPRLKQLASSFNEGIVIATKFVNHAGSGFTDIMHWDRLKDSPETNVLPFIEKAADYVIEKDTYTAYIPQIAQILAINNIRDVYVAGIDTDCCVLTTAISLFEHNIRPIVLTNYCASNGGEESHLAAIRVLERTIGREQIVHEPYPFQLSSN